MLNIMEYDKLAEIVRLYFDEKDFGEKIANNYRLKDHRWEHTKDKAKNILTPDLMRNSENHKSQLRKKQLAMFL